MRRRGGKKGGAREDDETVSTGCDAAVTYARDFVDSQEGLLSSRGRGGGGGGGGGSDILAPGLQLL